MHCASLGEFEQGRPVLEALKSEQPGMLRVLTFFSPSGYEVRKDYAGADLVMYLPADTPSQSSRFVALLAPDLALFVKYEYWANYFFACRNQRIPLVVISAILRPDQRFFGWFASFWKKVLACVYHFYVQDGRTQALLLQAGFANTTRCGDTRCDRVLTVRSTVCPDEAASQFARGRKCLVAGSTWPADEALLCRWLAGCKDRGEAAAMVLVPHEVNHIDTSEYEKKGLSVVRWSQRSTADLRGSDILLVDEIGHLAALYGCGQVAYVGGGFGKGIHNILEAAVWGVPVVFGPRHGKFAEAEQLRAEGAARDIRQAAEGPGVIEACFGTEGKAAGEKARRWVEANAGATARIMQGLRPFVRTK